MTAQKEFPEWMVTRALAAYVKKDQDGPRGCSTSRLNAPKNIRASRSTPE